MQVPPFSNQRSAQPTDSDSSRTTRAETAIPQAGNGSGREFWPVLLVHGWRGRLWHLEPLRRYLLAAGWATNRILALEFHDTFGSNLDHADEIALAVALLRERTGSRFVDIVAHSMGGLATRWYLGNDPTAPVRRVIYLATPHAGTWLAHAAGGPGAIEMRPGSEFLRQLQRLPSHATVRSFTIRTALETHVFPWRSALLPGATDHRVPFAMHAVMPMSLSVCRSIRRLLL